MPDDLTNLGNPQNNLHDWEENNNPHVTQIPPEAGIREDMFGDDPEKWDLSNPEAQSPNGRASPPPPESAWNH